MNEITASPAEPHSKTHWIEPVSAILMGVTSLSTAWCSFQNSKWSGQSSDMGAHADKLQRQTFAQHIESQQIESVQARMFMEAIDAQMKGDEKLARFYTDRFAGELKPAYEKWLALKPFENLAAPPHPFAPGLYVPRFQQEILDARAEATRDAEVSNAAGQTAASYLSNTVLLATVLFFAGTASKFHQRRVLWSSLAFAIAVLLYAVARMLTLPVA
jgi:hypothetical protein